MRKGSGLVAMLMCGSAFVALSAPASAQETTESTDATAAPQSAAEEVTPPEDIGEIVITGSRIQNGNTSPTPVTVVQAEALEAVSTSSIADGLNKMPQFVQAAGSVVNGNPTANTVGNFLNLRNLGTNRMLVLFDGHRVPDTAQTGGVDINTIAQFMLERVDVVTGGASAVYGSDAVAGVVNFIVDRKFTGLKLNVEAGISERGDNETQRIGVGYGANLFGDRGHILLSYNYTNMSGIESKTRRKNGALVPNLIGLGTPAFPFVPALNARLSSGNSAGVLIPTPQVAPLVTPQPSLQFAPGGTLIPFDPGAPTISGLRLGGEGFFFDTGMFAGLETHQGYGRFDYELTDSISAYVQGTYTISKNDYPFIPYQLRGLNLFTNNPFLTPETSAFLQSNPAFSQNGGTTFTVGKVSDQLTRVQAKTKNYFINGGLEGDLGDNLKWEVSYTKAQTKQRNASVFNIDAAKRGAALDAVRLPNGQIACYITTVDPTRYPDCVPLNLLGSGSISNEAIDFISDETHYVLTQKMDDFSATLTGSLFSLGNADPIKFAVNGEYRKNTLALVSTASPFELANCANIRLNCTQGTTVRYGNVQADISGSQKVSEIAGEVDIPLLKDLPLANSLSVSGAVRYTHYNTSGSVVTWKVGGDWRPIADLRFRATRSRDIRAPNIQELFGARSQFPSGFNDAPHTGQSFVIVQAISSGNPNLKPEKADTTTVGLVYRPNWLPRFSIAVDYYDIKIKDAITAVSGNTAYNLCEASNGTDPLCALIVRPFPFENRTPANVPTQILSQPQNVAAVHQSGVDTEINYSFPLVGGNVSLRALATYVGKLTTQTLSSSPVVATDGVVTGNGLAVPNWRVALFTGFTHGDWSINTLARYRSSLSYNKDPRLVFDVPKVDSVIFVDATISRKVEGFGGEAEFYVSIQNLFDKTAPIFYQNIGAPGFAYPAVIGDDVIGRRFNVGMRARF